MSWLTGSSPKIKKERRFSKEATQSLEDMQTGKTGIQDNPLYQAGSDWLMKILSGDTSVFEQPLMTQFNEQIVPQIAERFAGLGAGSSSGLNQTLAHAGSTLQENIAKLRADLMNNASQTGLQYAQQPITNQQNAFQTSPYQSYQTQGTQGLLAPAISGAAAAFGGPFGGAAANYATSLLPKPKAG